MLRLRSAQAWAIPVSCFEGPQHTAFGDANADGSADILQENHYYPFGMAMTMSSTLAAAPPNNYLYNGKELQDELDLGWYDYGARMYDASIGRWNGVDALVEVYVGWSPYNYVMGNPISFLDPNGMSVDYYLDGDGVLKFDEEVQSQDDLKEGETYVGDEVDVVHAPTGQRFYGDAGGNLHYYKNLDAVTITATGNPRKGEKSSNSGRILATDLQREVSYMSHGLNTYADIIEVGVNIWGTPGAASKYVFSKATAWGLAKYGSTLLRYSKRGYSLFKKTKPVSRVFWSGGETAMNGAAKYAEAYGLTTLEMTRAGKNLEKLTKGLGWEMAGPMWRRLSSAYAKGAKGTAYVVHNSNGINVNSVWRTIEYPILKENGVNIIYLMVP